MSRMNVRLAVVAVALMAAAVFTYLHDRGRAERFESGQKFLQNLNPDEIGSIEIVGSTAESGGATEGRQSVTLSRQSDQYVIAERNDYLARNEEVNRLIRDVLDVSLAKRMGEGDNLAAERGFEGPDAVSVTLENLSGEEMVSFRLGSTAEDGGRYIQRTSGEDSGVYRTEEAFSVATDPESFLRKEILDHSSGQVVRIQGPDFVLSKEKSEEGEWQGALQLERGTANSSEVSKLAGFLTRLSYDAVFVADDPGVSGLGFERTFVFDLDDKSGYRVEVADDKTGGAAEVKDRACFVRIRGLFNVDRLEVSQQETDQELEQKADVLRRSEEIAQFDQFHGSWIYKLGAPNCEKLRLTHAQLAE